MNDLTKPPEADEEEYAPPMEMGDTFHQLAEAHSKRLRVPKQGAVNRENVVRAFEESFYLIGGIPRLASWAHENPGDFFRLYGKLIPSSGHQTHDHVVEIVSKLPRTALDGEAVQEPVTVEGEFKDVG
jgi:hypothetical protein